MGDHPIDGHFLLKQIRDELADDDEVMVQQDAETYGENDTSLLFKAAALIETLLAKDAALHTRCEELEVENRSLSDRGNRLAGECQDLQAKLAAAEAEKRAAVEAERASWVLAYVDGCADAGLPVNEVIGPKTPSELRELEARKVRDLRERIRELQDLEWDNRRLAEECRGVLQKWADLSDRNADLKAKLAAAEAEKLAAVEAERERFVDMLDEDFLQSEGDPVEMVLKIIKKVRGKSDVEKA